MLASLPVLAGIASTVIFAEHEGSLHVKLTGPVADRIYERLLAFANFGFAESHALSFAALVFYSAWLKLHHPGRADIHAPRIRASLTEGTNRAARSCIISIWSL